MTVASSGYRQQRVELSDRYFALLALVLLGYAMFGKGFAYLGLPPLFIGEIMLLSGLLIFLRSGCFVAVIATMPSLILVGLIVWVLLRTVPYVGIHGVDALRDSVIVVYGGFAFITIALLLEKPSRLQDVMRYFTFFTALYGSIGALLYYLTKTGGDFLPALPGSDVQLVYVRAGELSVHLSAAVVFTILGLRRAGAFWIILLLTGVAVVSAQSRGGMLAILIPSVLACILGGKAKTAGKIFLLVAALLGVAYALDLGIAITPDARPIEARQIVDNLMSVFFDSGDGTLDGTKEFRVRWWKAIQEYTFSGDYFWTGKGFGINLAEADGFVVGTEFGGPLVRSPHNANMTILARAGVPGLVLWALTCLSWFSMLMRSFFIARIRCDVEWAKLFLFLFCYQAAIIIDASFDVALEGPMLGIWFWVIFGLGIGASLIYRKQHAPRIQARVMA